MATELANDPPVEFTDDEKLLVDKCLVYLDPLSVPELDAESFKDEVGKYIYCIVKLCTRFNPVF